MSNPSWANGVAKDETRLWTLFLWLAVIVFAAMSVLPIFVCIGDLVHPPPRFRIDFAAVLAPLVLIGLDVLLLGGAAYLQILRRKTGGSRFELSTLPGKVGGQLAGSIVTGKTVQFSSPVHLTLSCFEISTRGGRSGATCLWHEEQTLTNNLPADADGTRIPIYFDIPSHCSPTQHDKKHVRWRLTLHSPMPGVDYYATFIVPVFKTALEQTAIDSAKAYRITNPPPEAPHGSGVTFTEDSSGGVQIRFAAARHPAMAVQYTSLALIFASTPWILSYYGAGRAATIVFGVVLGLLALVVGLTAWGLWFNRSVVSVRMKTMELTRGQLFFSRTLRFNASDITRVRLERTQETQHGPWYCLELSSRKPGHKTVIIADGLFKHDGDRCVAQLGKSLGISPHPPK